MVWWGLGTLVQFGTKLYGVAGGGADGAGVLFEWDPLTNNYIKKIIFWYLWFCSWPCTLLFALECK